jgi:ubiquitin-protein ligase
MPRNVDYWYTLYAGARMVENKPGKKQLSEADRKKLEKKRQKKYELSILKDKNCIRRLMKDIKELAMCAGEFPNVSAAPLEDNIYLWHANVTAPDGPLQGLCVHMEFQFPTTYPRDPPRVKVLTPISHPNVFGSYICLTMLRKRSKYNKNDKDGWTGAYTVASILLQLQSFLFSENVPQETYDYRTCQDTTTMRENYIQYTANHKLSQFTCKRCCHTGKRPHPPIGFKCTHVFGNVEEQFAAQFEERQRKCKKSEKIEHKQRRKAAKEQFIAEKMAQHEEQRLVVAIEKSKCSFPSKLGPVLMEFLDPYEILMVGILYPTWNKVDEKYNLRDKYESSCFFTKLNYKEAALGYGVRVEYDLFKPKEIRQLASDLDLISWHAWKKLKYRLSAWGNEEDLYIPLVLNHSHYKNSSKLMWQQLRKLASVSAGDEDHNERILDAICALMNSMVVGMLKIEGEVRMHHSEKALQGYCRFHQLLLQVCKEEPAIRELAESKVEQFIKNPRARHKKGGTPDLGRLLVMLSVSDKYGWDDIKRPFFEEVTVRQQKWNIMGCPTLRFDTDTRDYGTWFRAMKPLEVLESPKPNAGPAKNPRGQPVRMPTAGTLLYGRKINGNWIKIDTPCRGYVRIEKYVPVDEGKHYLGEVNGEVPPSEPVSLADNIQELPFKYPALCITKRAAAGRMKISKSSRFMRTIEPHTYCVVVDIVGNRALVASVRPGKEQTTALKRKQTYAKCVKTIYGNIIIDIDMGDNGKAKPRQDAIWVSLETAKGSLLEKVEIHDDWRLDESFKHTQVSRQLIMFQKAFLDVIKEGRTLEELTEAYLSRWGNAPRGSLPALHKQVKAIKKSKTWNDYLSFTKLPAMSKADMIELLKRSVGNSERKRYTHSFHTGFDEIPDFTKHKPTRQVSRSFMEEDLGEDYVSRYARKSNPRPNRSQNRRRYDRDTDSGSSDNTTFNPQKHQVIKAYSKSGRRTFFKGVLYSLFLGGLPKDRDAKAVSSLVQASLPKNSSCRVPRDDDQLCRGFAFIEIPSLEDATYLVKNGIQISDERIVYPRFARQKASEKQV